MPDFYIARVKGESKAAHACRYIITRVCNDPNFAHYMLHTGALEASVSGYCEATGESASKVDKTIHEAWSRFARDGRKPDVVELRQEVEDLRDRSITAEMHCKDAEDLTAFRKAIWKIEERVRMAELGIEELDAETLRDILDARYAKA